ncbi:ParB/RepB/Spo0J family partition protein [Streptomyces sp. NPDC002324]
MTSTKAARTAKAPHVTAWPTLPVADLTAHVPTVAADPQLIESIRDGGFDDPLYVATLGDGTYRVVDGLRRLAAAVALEITDVPVTFRPVIRVEALSAHPGNVRQGLKLTKEFRASLRENGVRIPLKIKRTDAGALEVGDGHRRLAGALEVGLTHVPYEYDEVDEATRYTDMVTTAVHREALTDGEELSALFNASQLGASTKSLAAAAGRTQKDVKAMVAVGGSATVARVTAHATRSLTLDQLGQLADLEKHDPQAAARIERMIKEHPAKDPAWEITSALLTVSRDQEAAAHRAQLEEAGARIRTVTELSEKAVPVREISGVADHKECQGEVWVREPHSSRYTRYCANPPFYGHTVTTSGNPKPSSAERKAVIAGNQHWDAAEIVRREWLTKMIGAQHTKARQDELLAIVTTVMFEWDGVVHNKMPHPQHPRVYGELTGIPMNSRSAHEAAKRAATAAARRRPALLFANVAACFELYIPRTTWRTGQTGEQGASISGMRKTAAAYLTWLQGLGYEPTPIETAVIEGKAYNPAAAEHDATDTID